jgi:DNA-directed RNA polymerase subunit M/transcription elongation factor TFIIS
MTNCPMCGTETAAAEGRQYRYDNGLVTFEYVCPNCANLHDKLLTHGGAK